MDRGTLLKRLAVGGAALSVPTLAAAQTALAAPNAETANVFPSHPKWKFVFINHVTTNPFFVPTQYGAADACALVSAPTVDRLTERRRRQDDQRLQRRDQRQGRRHRRRGHRQGGVRDPDQAGARQGHPGRVVQRRRRAGRARTPARPTSARTSTSPASRWASRSSSWCRRAASRSSSPRRARSTSSRASTAHDAIKESGKPVNAEAVATGARAERRAAKIDAYYLGHKNAQGHVRGRRRLHPGRRPGDPEARLGRGIGGGYDLLPHAQADQEGLPELHHRPAALPAGLPPGIQLFL